MNTVVFEDQTLRDGLQNESRVFTLDEKLRLLDILVGAGLKRIQLGSFVHPKRVPQMADTDEFVRAAGQREGISLTGLILNEKGLERALDCGISDVALSVSVSDAHSRRNVNKPAREALDTMAPLVEKAVQAGLNVRAGLQCAFGCVLEGAIDPAQVTSAARTMASAGAQEINLADTTGMGNPSMIRDVCQRVQEAVPQAGLVLHLHNTRGLGISNMLAGYESGVRVFDVCTGGLGGCPFVKGAAGNIPTEDAVHVFEAVGVSTGVEVKALMPAVDLLEEQLGRSLPGHMKKVIQSGQPLWPEAGGHVNA